MHLRTLENRILYMKSFERYATHSLWRHFDILSMRKLSKRLQNKGVGVGSRGESQHVPTVSTVTLKFKHLYFDRCKQEQMYITKLGCALGSILFVISDGCIAIDGFVTPIPHRTVSRNLYSSTFIILLLCMFLSQIF